MCVFASWQDKEASLPNLLCLVDGALGPATANVSPGPRDTTKPGTLLLNKPVGLARGGGTRADWSAVCLFVSFLILRLFLSTTVRAEEAPRNCLFWWGFYLFICFLPRQLLKTRGDIVPL